MTANLIRGRGSDWTEVLRVLCARAGRFPNLAVPSCTKGRAWRIACDSDPSSLEPRCRFDEILTKLGQCRAWSPGHLVPCSSGARLSRG